jgi:xylan 1,4-beta-xylosidase
VKKDFSLPFFFVVILASCATTSYHVKEARLPAASQVGPTNDFQDLVIDAKAPETSFPHFWEKVFGSGRAILSVRESYRNDLRALKKATNLQYMRFHEILSDEVGVYKEDEKGNPHYNFTYVNQIYDGLLANGVRPFVEISYMPKDLALRPNDRVLWDQAIISPPKDYKKWDDLIRNFTKHLVDRYGIDEVSKWYFEVWNEAEYNWSGDPQMQTYFELYDHTAIAVKSIDSRLRVGGPATAAGHWINEFLEHVTLNNIPVDFVSSHAYADDKAEDLFGTKEDVPMHKRVCLSIKRTREKILKSHLPHLPLMWTEWSVPSFYNLNGRDTHYVGAGLAETIKQCDGLVDMMAYWTFSDVFDEDGVMSKPFTGWFGLVAVDGIKKPGFHGFELLHRLGHRQLKNDSPNVLVTRSKDGHLIVAAWNLVALDQPGQSQTFRFQFRNVKPNSDVDISRVDENNSNTLGIYNSIGAPVYPTRAQIDDINRRGEIQPPMKAKLIDGKINLDIPPNGLLLMELPN